MRQSRKRSPARYDALFDQIGDIVDGAYRAIETGDVDTLGPLMDNNHQLLSKLGVSSPKLDKLVEAARFAGARGAKLSGAGRGGNMITLAEDDTGAEVTEALREAGATRVIRTCITTTD